MAAGAVICTFDIQGHLLSANQESLSAWGFYPEELAGLHFSDLIIPEERNDAWLSIIDVVLLDKKISFCAAVRHKNGRAVEALWSAQSCLKEQKIYCVIASIRHRRLQRDRLSMVLHDLVTPLNSVRSLISLLSANAYGPISEKGRVRLCQGERELDKLARLVDDLLELEQISSGRLVLNKTVVAWDELIGLSIGNVQTLADEKSIIIDFNESLLKGVVDPARMTQVITDLLSNAIKFSLSGGTVGVKVFRTETTSQVEVSDHGVGIASDLIEHIFEGYSSRALDSGGRTRSSLGLAICKGIVEEHGGEIRVKSEPGEGATFTVVIPD